MADPGDIAVIGMACRFPGGIDSPESLWNLIANGGDVITEIPADRWDADEHYDAEQGVPGRSVSRWGGFLTDAGGFDAKFFKIAEREALATDPQHRVLLETAWEAVERSGTPPSALAGTRTGVFVGIAHGDYSVVTHGVRKIHPYWFTGTAFSMASGRISFALDLAGPSLSVDTACSSGLTSVHQACMSIRSGESDMALAGGVMLMLIPEPAAGASGLGMLSRSGRCRPFDRSADGFVRAEGCGMVFLKRATDALADGDHILAVIKGIATNQDGRTDTSPCRRRPRRPQCTGPRWPTPGSPREQVGMVPGARHGHAPSVTRSSSAPWPRSTARAPPLRGDLRQVESRSHRVGRRHRRADRHRAGVAAWRRTRDAAPQRSSTPRSAR